MWLNSLYLSHSHHPLVPFLSQSLSDSFTISFSRTHAGERMHYVRFLPPSALFHELSSVWSFNKRFVENDNRGMTVRENLWHVMPEARNTVVLLYCCTVVEDKSNLYKLLLEASDFFIQIFTCGPLAKPRHHTLCALRRCLEGKNECDVRLLIQL